MQQFKALTTKNLILFKRNKISSVLEFLIPIAFALLLIVVRKMSDQIHFQEQQFLKNTTFTHTIISDPSVRTIVELVRSITNPDEDFNFKRCKNKIIGLVSGNDSFANDFKKILDEFGYRTKFYKSDEEIDQIILSKDYYKNPEQICFALSFENNGTDYKYNVRFNVSNWEGPQVNEKKQSESYFDIGVYIGSMLSGFVEMITIVNNLILEKEIGNANSLLLHKIGMVYQEESIIDHLYVYLQFSGEFLIIFPLLFNFLKQTSDMLYEKEKKIRESMSISGMKIWMYYFTWFLRYFVVYLIINFVVSTVIHTQMPHVPFSIPFVLFFLFDILLIIQSFFIQVFVTKAKFGIVIALVMFTIQYVIIYVVANGENATEGIYRGISVVSHVAFILAFKEMVYAESIKTTLSFGTILNHYTINTAVISIFSNIIFWGILTLYLEQVFPNDWGAKKHPLLCFERFLPKKKENSKKEIERLESNASSNVLDSEIALKKDEMISEPVEERFKEMEKLNKAIIIENLYKTFDDGETFVVDGLSVKIYSDQIFVLLGHNGAGKTTTISMLTGMIKPTDGSILVRGETKIENIREKLGACPQHDTLYGELTVEEHIKLFASLRGASGKELDEEVRKLIEDVNLQEKKEEYSKNLSGGQKRRLSVAMAFSGGSKVIILDEPTSGMDTSARRYIWDMLKKYRKDRIIILTTHFMDEADYLGDRIAIMSSGKLAAIGSNVFLKNKFGSGYNMGIVKVSRETSSNIIFEYIKKNINNAKIISNFSTELIVQLPMESIQYFDKLFTDIDIHKESIGIKSYGVSITTLEEVFIRVSEEQESEPAKKSNENLHSDPSATSNEVIALSIKAGEEFCNHESQKTITKVPQIIEREKKSFTRFWWHFKATIQKRFRVIKRNKKSFIFEIILPMFFIVLALVLMRITFVVEYTNQTLNFDIYSEEGLPIKVPIASNQTTVVFRDKIINEMVKKNGKSIFVEKFIKSSDEEFDKEILFPMKFEENLKGGIFIEPEIDLGFLKLIPFTTIVNTKSPTSFATLQILAAEAYINTLKPNNPITITVVNKPLPQTYFQNTVKDTALGFLPGIIFCIAFAFKFASIAYFIVKEREERSKHQQIVSGMSIYSYWIANYVYDFILYLIVAVFAAGMCQALSVEALIKDEAYTAVCILLLFFGIANIPLTYIFGYLFSDFGNAQSAIYFFNFTTGGGLSICILIFRCMNHNNSNAVARGFAWLFRIIPAFSFGEGIMNVGSVRLFELIEDESLDPLSLEISLAAIMILPFCAVIFSSLIFVMEWLQNNEKFMRCITRENKYEEIEPKKITDSDVLEEQRIALAADPTEFEILTKNLRKVYTLNSEKKYKIAVDNVSFGIKKGEVFGLLGINGAGKTTMFKILSGEIVSSSGESYFSGLKTSEEIDTVRENLGYCPQFDALIENLTVQEQLELFYDMKSLPRQRKESIIEEMIVEMDLVKYKHKLSGNLSGGNKRKLSVAIAMIGDPGIIFLDEPSTGMDPKTRRFLWKVIEKITKESLSSTVILTTHVMEEAESLSSKIGIMVDGNFKCIGTPQHIKSKFGRGFEIELKIEEIKSDEIQNTLQFHQVEVREIDKSTLYAFLEKIGRTSATNNISKEGSGNYIWYELEANRKVPVSTIVEFVLTQERMENIINFLKAETGFIETIEHFHTYICLQSSESVSIGKLFSLLECHKKQFFILQYAIKQTTFEQIFNRFAEENQIRAGGD